jgi:hypothetical protein
MRGRPAADNLPETKIRTVVPAPAVRLRAGKR